MWTPCDRIISHEAQALTSQHQGRVSPFEYPKQRLFAIDVHCKNFFFSFFFLEDLYAVFLRLSLSTPARNLPFRFSPKCWNRPVSPAGLWVYMSRRNETPLVPSIISTRRLPTSFVQPSVSLISKFLFFFQT